MHALSLGPTSLVIQVAAALAALALVALTVWRWRRLRRLVRVVALLLVQVSLVLAVLIRVNAAGQLLTTWGAVAGSSDGLAPSVVAEQSAAGVIPRAPNNAWLVPPDTAAADRATAPTSTIDRVTLTGDTTGYSLPAEVYLPGGYQSHPTRSYPVLELLDGYPGGPQFWTGPLHLKEALDRLIASGQLPPVIAVLPNQNPVAGHDSECVDATAGYRAKADSYLAIDVPAFISTRYRAAQGRINWVIGGYSTGGYGAAHVGLGHPSTYGSIISLSGYLAPIQDHTTGKLFAHRSERNANSIRHQLDLAHPPTALYLIAANDNSFDRQVDRRFIRHVPASDWLRATATVTGGHSSAVWSVGFVDALTWLATTNQGR